MRSFFIFMIIPFVLNAEVNFNDLAAVAKNKLSKNPEFKKIIDQLPTTPPDKYFQSKKKASLKNEDVKKVLQPKKKKASFEKILNIPKKSTQKNKPPQQPKSQKGNDLEVHMLIDEDGNAYYPDETSNNVEDVGFIEDAHVSVQVAKQEIKKKPVKRNIIKKDSSLDAGELISLARKNNIDIEYINAFKNIAMASTVLPKDASFIEQLNNKTFKNFIEEHSEYSDSKYTIFFFADSHFDIKMFKRFSREVKVLNKSKKKSFTGRILTIGLAINAKEKKQFLDKYKIAKEEMDKLDPDEDKERIRFLKKQAQKYKDYSEGTFDTNYHWVKKLYKNGVSDVKVQFHPYAFKEMGLEQVPAYLLAQCSKDFRFKTCRKIALVRGNIPLREFYKLLSEDNKKYLPEYEILLKY